MGTLSKNTFANGNRLRLSAEKYFAFLIYRRRSAVWLVCDIYYDGGDDDDDDNLTYICHPVLTTRARI